MVSGLDLRAVGWVVTRDTCFDILRSLVGRPRRMPVVMLRRLGAMWTAVQAAYDADLRAGRSALLGAEASPATERRLLEFFEQLVAACPALYGENAMRRRCRDATLETAGALTIAFLLFTLASTESTLAIDVALILLVFGSLGVVTTFQLWRTRRALVVLGLYQIAPPPARDGTLRL